VKKHQVAVNLDGNWQPARMDVLPKPIEASWRRGRLEGKVAIDLPYHAGAQYKVDITGDLKNVSQLPAPLDKQAGQPLPVKLNVDGNLNSFALTGSAGGKTTSTAAGCLTASSRSTKPSGRRIAAPRRCPSRRALS
jgi:uncharacterized protein YhdP